MAAGDLMLMTRPVSSPSVSRAVSHGRFCGRPSQPSGVDTCRPAVFGTSAVTLTVIDLDSVAARLTAGAMRAAAAAARAYFFRDMEMLRDRWMDTMGYDARTKTQPPRRAPGEPGGDVAERGDGQTISGASRYCAGRRPPSGRSGRTGCRRPAAHRFARAGHGR